MKKKLVFLIGIMFILSVLSYGIIKVSGRNQKIKEEKVTIVTSFYPMYIIALNLTQNIDNVEVINLTDNNLGCLHDYQLTTMDMRTLSDADILILNGGEMEGFLEEVITSYPSLPVINASEDISFLEGIEHNHGESDHAQDESSHTHDETDHTHDEEEHVNEEAGSLDELEEESHEGHNHSAINGHVWLDMNRYLIQIENIANSLETLDSDNADEYRNNATAYMEKVTKLRDEFENTLALATGEEIVAFHGAFSYLADELGLEVIYALDMDSETALSAGDIATVIDEIRAHNVKYIFAEEQYSKEIAQHIANETDASVILLETLVGGDVNEDAYLLGVEMNLEQLKALFENQ